MLQQQPSLFGNPEAASPAKSDGGLIIREVNCRSLLNRSGISDYSFNCYTGCSHACGYCYARFMQRFHPHDEPWGQFVDVKINAPNVLTRQLRRLPPGSVFMCSACDGWQSIERHYRLTRRCGQLLLNAGFQLNVLTKSELVLRDLDVFAGRAVNLGVTITTPDERQARRWEPEASTVAARLNILREARKAGLKTHIMFGPLLPGISDDEKSLRELFELAREAQVDQVWTDALNARPRVWPAIQELLRTHHPHLLEHYRRMLFDPAARAQYLHDLDGRIRQARIATGMER